MPQNKNTGNFYKVLKIQKTYPIKINSTHIGSGGKWDNNYLLPRVTPMATERFDPIRGHLLSAL